MSGEGLAFRQNVLSREDFTRKLGEHPMCSVGKECEDCDDMNGHDVMLRDALKRARASEEALRKAIEKAPHYWDCANNYHFAVEDGEFVPTDPEPCDCWKSKALGGAPGSGE